VDFVFSYDSLVHVNAAVMDAYLGEISRVLSANGAAFLHHSNLGAYRSVLGAIRNRPRLQRKWVQLTRFEKDLHWRDPGVEAGAVESMAQRHGLQCIGQEIVPWGTKRVLLDCMSTLVRQGAPAARPNRVVVNRHFMQEAASQGRIAQLYGADRKTTS
jgi:hypothetical protein